MSTPTQQPERPPVSIRLATADDAPGISVIRVETWRATYRDIVPQPYLDSMDITEETARWRERLAVFPPKRCAYVAEITTGQGRALVGYVMAGPPFEPDPDYDSELYAIYILPACQGQGIGRRLFEAAAGWLAERGYRRMLLFVLAENAASRRFYEHMQGSAVREKRESVGGKILTEIGYGYDLAPYQNKAGA